MQKLSETVYASLFWLISGLVVWLALLPMAIIGLPIILLARAVGQFLFNLPQSNIAEAEKQVQTSPRNRPANLVESLLTSLLLTALVEVPALLAAVISLQPTRLLKGKSVSTQKLRPLSAKAYGESTTDPIAKAVEISVKENRSDR